MAMRREAELQEDPIVIWAERPRSPGHAFYDRRQKQLIEVGFDAFPSSRPGGRSTRLEWGFPGSRRRTGLEKGERIGADGSMMEANATLRSIVRARERRDISPEMAQMGRPGLSSQQKKELWARWKAGQSLSVRLESC
jgi:hypothetical protein